MSVFKVKLNNGTQGKLDVNPDTGTTFGISKQRQIYVAGPNRKIRILSDGDVFTDCNYWKRFTKEFMGEENAFIEIVSDDGSVYSENSEENTYSVGNTLSVTTSFSATVIDFMDLYGSPARFLMVQNIDNSIPITGELNGNSGVTFIVGPGETMMFNQGDVVITKLRLKSDSGNPSVTYIASVRSDCKT